MLPPFECSFGAMCSSRQSIAPFTTFYHNDFCNSPDLCNNTCIKYITPRDGGWNGWEKWIPIECKNLTVWHGSGLDVVEIAIPIHVQNVMCIAVDRQTLFVTHGDLFVSLPFSLNQCIQMIFSQFARCMVHLAVQQIWERKSWIYMSLFQVLRLPHLHRCLKRAICITCVLFKRMCVCVCGVFSPLLRIVFFCLRCTVWRCDVHCQFQT